MITTGSIEIEKPIEVVFDYTINNVVDWSETVTEESVLEKDANGNAKRFHIVTKDPKGNPMEFEGEVTLDEPPTRHAILMKNDTFDIAVEYTFDSLGDKTKVTQVSHVTAKKLFFKLLFSILGLFSGGACKELDKELACLKEKTEALG